jgi:hypothetical protein
MVVIQPGGEATGRNVTEAYSPILEIAPKIS